MRVGDWMKFHCGDMVYDIADPRHIGRVIAIQHGAFLVVKWEETGWLSEGLPFREMRKYVEEQE